MIIFLGKKTTNILIEKDLRPFQRQIFTVINAAILYTFFSLMSRTLKILTLCSLPHALYYAVGRNFKLPFLIAVAILYFFFLVSVLCSKRVFLLNKEQQENFP